MADSSFASRHCGGPRRGTASGCAPSCGHKDWGGRWTERKSLL